MQEFEFLIISDIHLGSGSSRTVVLLETLRKYPYKKLIVLGDLYEKGSDFTDEHFAIVTYLRNHREKVIYVDGNHDPAEEGLISIIGVEPVKKYEFALPGKKVCTLHGHQFDRLCFIFSEPLVDKMFLTMVNLLKTLSFSRFNVAKWIDDFYESLALHHAKKASKYAKKRNIDVIICGHTHKPVHLVFERKEKDIEYINCGSWVEKVCSFITVDHNGAIELHEVF